MAERMRYQALFERLAHVESDDERSNLLADALEALREAEAETTQLEASYHRAAGETDAWRAWARQAHGAPLTSDDAARDVVDDAIRFLNGARLRLQRQTVHMAVVATEAAAMLAETNHGGLTFERSESMRKALEAAGVEIPRQCEACPHGGQQ